MPGHWSALGVDYMAEMRFNEVRGALALIDQAVGNARGRARLRLGFSWLLPAPWRQNALALFEALSPASVDFVNCPDHLAAMAARHQQAQRHHGTLALAGRSAARGRDRDGDVR